jgi:hypothetical protein
VIERLIPGWAGKLLVLLLLAFVATDYVVTQNLGGWKTPGVTTKLILWNPLICVALLGRWWNHGFELAKEQPWTAMTRGLLS